MADSINTELVVRVHIDGHAVEVGGFEVPGFVELRTVGDNNRDYFGPLNLSLSPDTAEALADALRTVAAHERKQEGRR